MCLSDGDKLGMYHGQKGVVKVLKDKLVPRYNINGRYILPDMVVSMTSLCNRATAGIVKEIEKIGAMMKRSVGRKIYTMIKKGGSTRYVEIKSVNGDNINILIGTCRVYRLCQTVSSKQLYTNISSNPMGYNVRLGNSVRFGEMDYQALYARGLTETVNEFLQRSGMCYVEVCNSCNRLRFLCDCPNQCSSYRTVLLRASSIVLDIANSVVMDYSNVYK